LPLRFLSSCLQYQFCTGPDRILIDSGGAFGWEIRGRYHQRDRLSEISNLAKLAAADLNAERFFRLPRLPGLIPSRRMRAKLFRL